MALPEGKMLDTDTMEIVDKPKDDSSSTKQESPLDKGTPEDDPDEKKEEDDAGKVEDSVEEEEKKEESEEEKKEEESPADKKDEEKKEEEEPAITVDDYLSERYSAQGIKSEEDLDKVLASLKEKDEELTRLREEAKTAKPKFSTEQEEKAFEFLKAFDVSKMNEGARTFANLIFMDVEKAEPRVILEERFIFDHPELTRDESLRKFNRDYKKKYEVEKDQFDDEAKFKEEEADKAIDLKTDVAKAKKYLISKQVEFKAKPKEEAENKNEAKENAAVQKSIKTNVSDLEGFVKDFSELVFSPSDDNKDDFTYKLSKEQLAQVKDACKAWIGNPTSYNEKGELVGGSEVSDMVKKTAGVLFFDDMMDKAYKAGLTLGESKRADQIAQTKPDRQAKVADGSKAPVREEDQIEELIKIKKRERASRPMIPQRS